MASTLIVVPNISLSTTNSQVIRLASKEIVAGLSAFDMPLNYCFDFNLASSTANGLLEIFLQNDNPLTSAFTINPIQNFLILNGVFANGRTKMCLDSGGFMNAAYMLVKYTSTSGTGVLSMNGQISYKG